MSSPTATMTEPPPTPTSWAAVYDWLDAFSRAWDAAADGPPNLGAFLPPDPPAFRRLVLVELVKIDIARRLRGGAERPLEEYARDFPELAAGGVPVDLLYEDLHYRRAAGRTADAADYFRRFPGQASELARLVGGGTPVRTTSVYAARPPVRLAPGDRVDDFDLLTLLGEGQFARVFLARQRSMQRLVALKVSAHQGAEAQTLARLDHPHVVRVFDQRVLPDRAVQLVYMQYLPGGTLDDVLAHARAVPADERTGQTLLDAVGAALARRGEAPPAGSAARQRWAGLGWAAAVCALGAKLAAALAYAHREGVLHRDVKPANVLLTADGDPLLADFNVGSCSKLDGAGPAALFGGSLGYMSPEHLEAFSPDHPRPAESLDGKTDVFGLAVTLWELAAGDRPFPTEALLGNWAVTLALLAEQRRAGPAPAVVGAFPADVPGLRDVLLRCLDADPARRPDAGELARELELCLRPATRALVRPAAGGWAGFVRRHPLLAIYPTGLAPNVLGSLFNIAYNRAEIIAHWPAAAAVFDRVILAVNGVFFPIGMALFAVVLWPVVRGVGRVRAGAAVPAGERARLRGRALRLGGLAAGVCVGCWAVAGAVWPVVLWALAGSPPNGPGTYVHFLLSLVVCGLVAAAYPYFLITFLAVRVVYPALLGPDGPAPCDGPALRKVERQLARYRAAAAAVPLLTVALLASRGTANPAALAVLAAAGLFGVGVAYALEGLTRADLAALDQVPGGAG